MIDKLTNLFKLNKEEIEESTPNYVDVLFENLKSIQMCDEVISFEIVRTNPNGYVVKVKGLYAFIPYSLMPWKYSYKYWNYIDSYIIGARLFGKIVKIEERSIVVDASHSNYSEFNLQQNKFYEAIILKKGKKFVLIEIGNNFQWKFGSLTYYILLDKQENNSEFEIYLPGDVITLQYDETINHWERIYLGESKVKDKLNLSKELYLGMYRKIKLTKNPEFTGKLGVLEDDNVFSFLETKSNNYDSILYPHIKEIIRDLKENEEIICQYILISKVHNKIKFISKA